MSRVRVPDGPPKTAKPQRDLAVFTFSLFIKESCTVEEDTTKREKKKDLQNEKDIELRVQDKSV